VSPVWKLRDGGICDFPFPENGHNYLPFSNGVDLLYIHTHYAFEQVVRRPAASSSTECPPLHVLKSCLRASWQQQMHSLGPFQVFVPAEQHDFLSNGFYQAYEADGALSWDDGFLCPCSLVFIPILSQDLRLCIPCKPSTATTPIYPFDVSHQLALRHGKSCQ
jgi:hypothetical protein